MTKQELRRKNIALRSSIPLPEKELYDFTLTKSVLSLPEFAFAESILLYAGTGSEMSTDTLFHECIKANKKVYFPKCLNNENMEFYRVKTKNDFVTGMYGISEPATTEKYTSFNKTDIAVIPALAVGRDFSRLGYGKGYYDRFLNKFDGLTVCPVYSSLICDTVPTDMHDIPLNVIITPNEIIRKS